MSSFALHPLLAPAAEPFGVTLYGNGVKGCKNGVCAEGVYVDAVTPGSRAAHSGLRAKDLITKISGASVTKPGEVSQLLDTTRDEIQLTVFRRGELIELRTDSTAASTIDAKAGASTARPQLGQAADHAPAGLPDRPKAMQHPTADPVQLRDKTLKQTAYLQQLRKTMRLAVKSCAPGDIRIGGTLPPGALSVTQLNVRYRVLCSGAPELAGTIYGYRGDGLSCTDSDMRPIELSCSPMDARVLVDDVITPN